jgi:hypothetical protein
MIDLSSIHLNTIVHTKNKRAKHKCTVIRVFFCIDSVAPSFRLMPRMSMQKEEVSAVSAPSAEGNNAEMRPMINKMDTEIDK